MISNIADKPGAPPLAPEIEAIGPKFVELSWQPPEHDGGSPIIGYILERMDVAGRTWMPINKVPISDTKFKVNNLFEDIPYRIRVRAVNDEGIGEPSPETEQFYCREQKGRKNHYKKFPYTHCFQSGSYLVSVCPLVCVHLFYIKEQN